VTDERPPDRARPGDEEFGPGGYLPKQAASRARKIILRAPMGAGWIIASVALGVLIFVAGAIFLSTVLR